MKEYEWLLKIILGLLALCNTTQFQPL